MSTSTSRLAAATTESERWHTTMLIVGHPGHELRLHAWLELARPTVCVLTDGGGARGEGRLSSTTRLLTDAGATSGPIYGRLTDRALYDAILEQDLALFTRLADDLCDTIIADGATSVVGDAAEGYNPCHDVCRLLINAAVRMASRTTGEPIEAFDFALVGAPDGAPDGSAHFALDDDALARKIGAANAYPEMAAEVAAAIERFGVGPFRHEVLRPVDLADRFAWPVDEKPFYEVHGERRVAEGVYDRVLRFREHVAPIAEALWSHSTHGA